MADLQHQIFIKSSPEKTYAAIATTAGLKRWWTADSMAETSVGGKAEFGFDQRAAVFGMRIEALEPGKRVAWRCESGPPDWVGTTFTWEFDAKGDGTTLRFTHGGWRALTPDAAMCNSTWGTLLYRIKDDLEGREPGPLWRA